MIHKRLHWMRFVAGYGDIPHLLATHFGLCFTALRPALAKHHQRIKHNRLTPRIVERHPGHLSSRSSMGSAPEDINKDSTFDTGLRPICERFYSALVTFRHENADNPHIC